MKIHHINTASFCPLNLIKITKVIKKINTLLSYLPLRSQSFIEKKILEVATGPLAYMAKEQLQELLLNQFQWDVEKEINILKDFKEICNHCLLVESSDGVILVDTGIGYKFSNNPEYKLRLNSLLLGFPIDASQSAYKQVLEKGYLPEDIRHIFVSHLDFDHAGGLVDFPEAKIHLSEYELNSAVNPVSYYSKNRYWPKLWDHNPDFELYNFENSSKISDTLYGQKMEGFKEDIFIVPLSGHTVGHTGILFEKDKLVFAGDAYLHHQQLDLLDPYEGLPVKIYNNLTMSDKIAYDKSLNGLKELKQSGYKVICSHDYHEFCNC